MTTEQQLPWAKILTTAISGQALVCVGWDGDRDTDVVTIETRARVNIVLTLEFTSEEMARAAFDAITDDNIDDVRKGRIPASLGGL